MSQLVKVDTEEVLLGEVMPPLDSIEARALDFARAQASPDTRRTYETALHRLAAVVGGDRLGSGLAADDVIRLRDALIADGLSASTVAVYLSAVRGFAAAVGADPMIQHVKAPRIAPGAPRALSKEEVDRLLKMPDRRTMRGVRDFAVLQMLLDAGPRASELSNLDVQHVEKRPRADDGRLRGAIPSSTVFWLVIASGKRGKGRAVPMTRDLVDALAQWRRVRPTTSRPGHEAALYLSQQKKKGAEPTRLSKRAIHTIVHKHATAAGVRADRCHPHALRHTFCTRLAQAGVRIEVIQKLAGHSDISTTTIYTETADAQLVDAIESAEPASAFEELP